MATLFPKYLQPGTTSPAVRVLQTYLLKLGYFRGRLAVDGYYGVLTVQAVMELQKRLGVTQSGSLDPATKYVLRKLRNVDFDSFTDEAVATEAVAA